MEFQRSGDSGSLVGISSINKAILVNSLVMSLFNDVLCTNTGFAM